MNLPMLSAESYSSPWGVLDTRRLADFFGGSMFGLMMHSSHQERTFMHPYPQFLNVWLNFLVRSVRTHARRGRSFLAEMVLVQGRQGVIMFDIFLHYTRSCFVASSISTLSSLDMVAVETMVVSAKGGALRPPSVIRPRTTARCTREVMIFSTTWTVMTRSPW